MSTVWPWPDWRAEGRIASPDKRNVKIRPHLAYISVLAFLWFSVSCCFFPMSLGISIAIHIRIHHHFSIFSGCWLAGSIPWPVGTFSEVVPPWLKPLVTPLPIRVYANKCIASSNECLESLIRNTQTLMHRRIQL